MDIVINYTDEHNNFFTLTDDEGVAYLWFASKEAVLNAPQQLLNIRLREYPRAPRAVRGTLEDIEQWIADGRKITVKVGKDGQGHDIYEEQVAEKKPWKGTHPPILKLKERYQNAQNDKERLDIIAEHLFGN